MASSSSPVRAEIPYMMGSHAGSSSYTRQSPGGLGASPLARRMSSALLWISQPMLARSGSSPAVVSTIKAG